MLWPIMESNQSISLFIFQRNVYVYQNKQTNKTVTRLMPTLLSVAVVSTPLSKMAWVQIHSNDENDAMERQAQRH